MLKPSYAELMDTMNKDKEGGSSVTSRYSVVIAAAKRARQIIAGDTSMLDEDEINGISDKPLSIAVKEIELGKIKVVPEGMGTKIEIKKESLKDEIKSELERQLAEVGQNGEEDPVSDEELLGEDFSSEEETEETEVSDEDFDDNINILDFDEEE